MTASGKAEEYAVTAAGHAAYAEHLLSDDGIEGVAVAQVYALLSNAYATLAVWASEGTS